MAHHAADDIYLWTESAQIVMTGRARGRRNTSLRNLAASAIGHGSGAPGGYERQAALSPAGHSCTPRARAAE